MAAFTLCLSGAVMQGCSDDIDESNRYTFTGETVVDFLENRSETFSDFIYILNRAVIGRESSGSVKHLLSTYGSYTCFAPTNEAIQRHLYVQDSTYWADKALLDQGLLSEKDFHDTGIHSPNLEELSDSMCAEIAKNHILEKGYLTTELAEGAFPEPNMNDRYITLYWVADTVTGNVSVKLNDSSIIIDGDNEVENGVVQIIDQVLSPSTALLPDLLKSYDELFGLMSEALSVTGVDELIRETKRNDCEGLYGTTFQREWQKSNGISIAKIPETHYVKFTILAIPDVIFKENGIETFAQLVNFANEWYGEKYYSDVDYDDYTSRNNPLNRFVSYLVIDRSLQYSGGFVQDNIKLKNGFDSELSNGADKLVDRYDYFETLLDNGRPLKVTKPYSMPADESLANQIVINYGQNKGATCRNIDMRNHINVKVIPVSEFKTLVETEIDFKQEAINGMIHPINKLLVYNNDEMKGNVLYERMRWNFMSFFPELTNNNIRWAYGTDDAKWCYYMVPDGYCERIKFNSAESHMYYLYPHSGSSSSWADYQGDEIITAGMYDFEYRIPHVPAGNYELRLGTCLCDSRGVAQVYVDGKVTGIPVDLRTEAASELVRQRFAFVLDSDLDDEEAIEEDDKARRNRGWMKGPASAFVNSGKTTLRDSYNSARLIIGTFSLTDGDHWIRFKNVMEGDNTVAEFMHNYFEIVPKGIITDVSKPEDKN